MKNRELEFILSGFREDSTIEINEKNPRVIEIRKDDKPFVTIFPDIKYAFLKPINGLRDYFELKRTLSDLGYEVSEFEI